MEQLSPCAIGTEPVLRAREPQLLNPLRLQPVICNKRNYLQEKRAHQNKQWAPLATN